VVDKQEVIDALEFLDTWEERFQLIAELEGELVPLPESDLTDEHLVPGCTTRTWVSARLTKTDPPVLEFMADAEGPLVRGLVALLLMPFQHKTPAEVLATDAGPFIRQLDLESALTAKRRAGMYAFLERIKHIAHLHEQAGASSLEDKA
jgi:cysteine desulfuration protein SufE